MYSNCIVSFSIVNKKVIIITNLNNENLLVHNNWTHKLAEYPHRFMSTGTRGTCRCVYNLFKTFFFIPLTSIVSIMCSTIFMKWTIQLAYYIETIGFVTSTFLNSILLFLISKMSKQTFGNYNYLMFSFSSFSIVYSFVNFWSKPVDFFSNMKSYDTLFSECSYYRQIFCDFC